MCLICKQPVTDVNVKSEYAYKSVGLTVAIVWVCMVGSAKSDPCPTVVQCIACNISSKKQLNECLLCGQTVVEMQCTQQHQQQ